MNQHVGHAQHKGPIRAREGRNPLIGLRRGDRATRVEAYYPHASHARVRHTLGAAGKMQVRGKSVTGADLDPVVAEIVVVDSGERPIDAAIHRMVGASTVIPQRGEEVRRAERRRPAPQKNPLEVANGAEQLARIIGPHLAQFPGNYPVGFLPRDLYPFRIHARSLARIGPLHGLEHPIGIVQA